MPDFEHKFCVSKHIYHKILTPTFFNLPTPLYEMIQNLPKCSKKTILQLCNQTWANGQLPENWMHAIILQFLKENKEASDSNSYRSVALTSTLHMKGVEADGKAHRQSPDLVPGKGQPAQQRPDRFQRITGPQQIRS